MEGYISEVRMFAPDFAPKNWALCNGAILPISQWQALFSLLGTQYGGDGQTTFALPDLRGRVPVGPGRTFIQGQQFGTETTTITGPNLPPHNHSVGGSVQMLTTNQPANSPTPGGNYFANDGSAKFDPSNDQVTMASPLATLVVGPAGSLVPVDNHMPYLAINYVICLAGIFPTRN
jgi:microcystin-dependent protein